MFSIIFKVTAANKNRKFVFKLNIKDKNCNFLYNVLKQRIFHNYKIQNMFQQTFRQPNIQM